MSLSEQDLIKTPDSKNSILKQNQIWLEVLASELRQGLIKPPGFIDALRRKPLFKASIHSKSEAFLSGILSIDVSQDGEIFLLDEYRSGHEIGTIESALGLTETGELNAQLRKIKLVQIGGDLKSFIKEIPAEEVTTDNERLIIESALVRRLSHAGSF